MTITDFENLLTDDSTFDDADLLDRRGLGLALTNLVRNSEAPLVVALDDEWGTGKTHFLKLWKNHLHSEDIPAVYLNAFVHDLSPDAFATTVGSVSRLIHELAPQKDKLKMDFKKTAKNLGLGLTRVGTKVAVKAITSGTVEWSAAEGAIKDAIQALGDEADAYLDEAIENAAKLEVSIERFKAQLQEVRSNLAGENNDLPLVLIVDELDRCRPTFALELLEVLKHFFGAERVHVILGVNVRAMASSVEHLYGSKIDGERYLGRFLSFRIGFQETRFSSSADRFEAFIRELLERGSLGPIEGREVSTLSELLARMIGQRGGSLRDAQRIVNNLELCATVIEKRSFRVSALLSVLLVMKHFDPKLFKEAVAGTIALSDVERFLGFTAAEIEDENGDGLIRWVIGWWRGLLAAEKFEEDAKRLSSDLFRVNFREPRDAVRYIARDIIERFWQG